MKPLITLGAQRLCSVGSLARLVLACAVMLSFTSCAALRGIPKAPASDTLSKVVISPTELTAMTDKDKRNSTVLAKLALVDAAFYEYIGDLNRQKRGGNLFSKISVLGLTSAATLVTPVGTKNILSASAALITGSDAAVNSEVYDDLKSTAVLAQMLASRKKVGERIRANMAKSLTDYPAYAAASDVTDYYRAGTYLMAATELVSSATESANTSQVAATTVTTYGNTAEAEKIRVWLFEADPANAGELRQNPDRRRILQAWLNDRGRFINAIKAKTGADVTQFTEAHYADFVIGGRYFELQKEFVEKSGNISQ